MWAIFLIQSAIYDRSVCIRGLKSQLKFYTVQVVKSNGQIISINYLLFCFVLFFCCFCVCLLFFFCCCFFRKTNIADKISLLLAGRHFMYQRTARFDNRDQNCHHKNWS